MGVQLPGPDDTSVERGFITPGTDMSMQPPEGTDPVGVRMPFGAAPEESGWLNGEDQPPMVMENIPVANTMGAWSDNEHNTGDLSVTAGFHNITTFEEMYAAVPGLDNEQPTGTPPPGTAMQGLTFGAIPNQGYPGIGLNTQGIDSMQGLYFYGGQAPEGNQDTNNTGPGVPANSMASGDSDDQSAVGR